jgi:hypothetical protein
MIFVLLCGTVLAGCATTAHPDVAKLTGGDTATGHAKKEVSAIDKTAPTDLEGGVRQAQLMRLAGHYAMSSTFYSRPRRVTVIPAPTCP